MFLMLLLLNQCLSSWTFEVNPTTKRWILDNLSFPSPLQAEICWQEPDVADIDTSVQMFPLENHILDISFSSPSIFSSATTCLTYSSVNFRWPRQTWPHSISASALVVLLLSMHLKWWIVHSWLVFASEDPTSDVERPLSLKFWLDFHKSRYCGVTTDTGAKTWAKTCRRGAHRDVCESCASLHHWLYAGAKRVSGLNEDFWSPPSNSS